MQRSRFANLSATVLLTVGFAVGAVFTMSCGGGSGGGAFAHLGATGERHVQTAPPSSFSSPGVLIGDVFSTVFTPSDPNDVILRVSVRGTRSTTATSIVMTLSVRNAAGNFLHGSASGTVPVGMNAPFRLSTTLDGTNFFPGAGAPDGAYQIAFDVVNGDPGGSAIDFGEVTLEVVTLRGVTLLNPSPLL